MFTIGVENAENVTAMRECLIDVGDQSRQFRFDLTALLLDDIADLLVFAKVNNDRNHSNECRDNGCEKQKRNSKYANEECFDNGVCHVLFGRHTHIGTIKVNLELKSLIVIQSELGSDQVSEVAKPDIERIGFLVLPLSKACDCLGYWIFGDLEYIREDKRKANCGDG